VADPNIALGADVSEIVANAARGDIHAQRRIRQSWLNSMRDDQTKPANAGLIAASGLFVARMCAANGDYSDVEMLAALLLTAGVQHHGDGREDLASQCVAESLALFDRMAAAGDEDASKAINALVPEIPIEVVERAKLLVKMGEP
jgi:hypothetical protein